MISFFLFLSIISSRKRSSSSERFSKDNDPVHYMRELEFRNTIDQYDLALVLFFRKDVDECKRMLPGFRFAAHKSIGKADFIAVTAKSATDLCDELGVDTFPTIFSFRNGHLIEKIENRTSSKDLYIYVKSVIAAKYKYVHDSSKVPKVLLQKNATLVVSMESIDARLDKLLDVITTKFHKNLQIVVSTTSDVSTAFKITEFPSICIVRNQDDTIISFQGNPNKVTYKTLTDFVEKNIEPRFMLIQSFQEIQNKYYFLSLFDTTNETQTKAAKEVLERVASDHPNKFPIRYADALQLRHNLTLMHINNYELPFYMFIRTDRFGYIKYIYNGKISPQALSAFCSDQLRGRNAQTIASSPVEKSRSLIKRSLIKYFTGSELFDALKMDINKDYVVNFVGYPCPHCDEVDSLFNDTAQFVKTNNVKNVVFARVNATSNDIPNSVWRNETYPYGWFFPANNRTGAFPIGKRRQLYWMVQLLVDNCTTPVRVQMPPKPTKTPFPRNNDL